ncbi:hypothetical protein BCR44DRAFT_39486 [Catenaria anguillulae PL171]|uniref:Uncharacterized protein n=1 Tax=Catenaria anguillulae PL171 TaxID=765915 RepID=A0A1Y2HR00_9FUNG|nr:hypothetical protein BCR44DRAFT_39486 [Catenaria anguillulae PL171]
MLGSIRRRNSHLSSNHVSAAAPTNPPLWVSPPVASALVGRFLGPRASRLLELKSHIPALRIRFDPVKGDTSGTFPFRVWVGCGNSAQADVQAGCLTRYILDALHCPWFVYRTEMTHTLDAPREQLVQWCQVLDNVANLAAELDVVPPLYYLRQTHTGDGNQMAEEVDLSVMLGQLFLADKSLVKAVRHDQTYMPPAASPQAELERLSTQVANKYLDVCKLYPRKQDRMFRLSASFGAHVYGKDRIQGLLSRVIPAASCVSGSPTAPAYFSIDTLMSEFDKKHIKPTFNEAYPLDTHAAIVSALESADFFRLNPLATLATCSTSEKVTITFQLSPAYISSHAPAIGPPEIQGYVPEYQFKITFVYDTRLDRFVVSPKGLVPRSARLMRHTWVHTVPAATEHNTGCMPVMPRLKVGVARVHDRPHVWTLATKLVDQMDQFVHANLAALRHPQPVNTGDDPVELARLPPLLLHALSHFFIRHKHITSLVSASDPEPAAPAISVSVRKTTMFYRFNDPVGGKSRADMRNELCVVPRAQPTFVGVRMADGGFGEQEQRMEAENVGCELDWVEKRVVGFAERVQELAKVVRVAVCGYAG